MCLFKDLFHSRDRPKARLHPCPRGDTAATAGELAGDRVQEIACGVRTMIIIIQRLLWDSTPFSGSLALLVQPRLQGAVVVYYRAEVHTLDDCAPRGAARNLP